MSAPSDDLPTEHPPWLPSLTTLGASADPHVFTVPARTGTNIELRIHTSLTVFDVTAGHWTPAVSGFVVTVFVHSVDAATGRPRHLPPAEPGEWARAIFADVDAAQGYFLGAVDPDRRAPERTAGLPALPRHRPAGDPSARSSGRLSALPDARR